MEMGFAFVDRTLMSAKTEVGPDYGAPSSVQSALRDIVWLHGVSSQTIDRLASQAVLHRVPAGSILFEQGEIPMFAQFLLAGSVEMLGCRNEAETLVELILPVDMILPATLVTEQPYLMRARVNEEAQLLLVRGKEFRDAIASDLGLCSAVLACVAAQFRRQVRHSKNLKLRSAEDRVGCYLVSLLGDVMTGVSIQLPIEKRLIASQLGMTRETFSRALAGMAKFGMIIRGDILYVEDSASARTRFPLDPLIDGGEPISLLGKTKL